MIIRCPAVDHAGLDVVRLSVAIQAGAPGERLPGTREGGKDGLH